MDLKLLVKRLQDYADLSIAYSCWEHDNIGLLVEPTEPLQVKRVLITNDLTEPVLEEAIKKNINLIISYHPAIFKPLKRLTQSEWKQRSIVKCIENRIAVYSPHTSWDCRDGGINDWILEAFDTKKVEGVQEAKSLVFPCGFSKNLHVNCPETARGAFVKKLDEFKENLKFISEKEIIGPKSQKQFEFEFLASPKGVVSLIEAINSIDSNMLANLRIHDLDKPLLKNVGLGRIGYLNEPMKIADVVAKMKVHLNMKTFRLALANGKSLEDKVRTIAVGAGSASKILNNVNADLFITGEFSHHEILHEVHRGVSLIVTDHSNTERGYQRYFKEKFTQHLQKTSESDKIEILLSEVDRDPLEYI